MSLPDSLQLEVSTPEGTPLKLATKSVQVPGAGGEFGVLPGHLPILAAVKPGLLKYDEGGKTKIVAIGSGFAEGGASHVRLLTEFFMTREKVNEAEAREDLRANEARMKAFAGEIGDAEHTEIERNLAWAQARIELANSSKN